MKSLIVAIMVGVFIFLVSTSMSADDSASVYKAKCAACHAADGSSNVAMGKALGAKDLRSEEVQKHSDAELHDSIANGMGTKMPAYKDKLTDDQIKGLVGYIRDMASKKK